MAGLLGIDVNHAFVVEDGPRTAIIMPALRVQRPNGSIDLMCPDSGGTAWHYGQGPAPEPRLVKMAEIIIRGGAKAYLQILIQKMNEPHRPAPEASDDDPPPTP